MRKAFPLCILATLFCLSHFCFGQANINEGLETAFLYVDPNGSDSNSGGPTWVSSSAE